MCTAAPGKHGKPVEILQLCLPVQPEDTNGLQHSQRSHIPKHMLCTWAGFKASPPSVGVWQADRSLLWVPWTEPLASVGVVRAGALEFIACENDLQAAPDA